MTEDHNLIKAAKSARDGRVTEAGDIPEDIKAQAWSLFLELKFHEGPSHQKLEMIEAAILAEREASAKIAEERHSYPVVKLEWDEEGGRHEAPAGRGGPGADIAEAIRRR